MNDWTWLRAKRSAPTPASSAYGKRVTANKDKAGRKRRHEKEKAEAARIRRRNDEPLY